MLSIRIRLVLVVAIITLAFASRLDAARFFMPEGEVIEAAYIGKANGVVTVLDASGKTRTLDEASILTVDFSHKLSKSLEARAKRKRGAFFRKRRRDGLKLVKKLARAKPEKREAIEAEFDGFEEYELIAAFDRGLRSEAEHVRTFSLDRLKTYATSSVAVALVNNAITHPDREYATTLHEFAVEKHRDQARKLYEYVSHVGEPEQRIRALEAIQSIGDQKSVPQLIWGLSIVESTIRAQLVRSKGLRQVPVQLGTNTNVSIELPEVELIEVNTTTQVSVRTLRRIETATLTSLTSITGEDFGTDIRAWKLYLKAKAAEREKAEEAETSDPEQ